MNSGQVTAWHYLTGKPVSLRWIDGAIAGMQATDSAEENLWIAPSLVDLQINGFAGVDFQQDDLDVDTLRQAARGLRQQGCGRWLLTLISDTWPRLTRRLRHLTELRASSADLQQSILGFHVEGPFLSDRPGFCGTHNPEWMMDPTPDRIQELHEITGVVPVLLTLAPERQGAIECIRLAVSLGMVISLGHTDASSDTLRQAVQAGACAFTHLANGCPQCLDRHDNILWRVIETPGLTTSLIPDSLHVRPAPFRLLHRLLDPTQVCYTTDAMSAAGAPPGRYQLGSLQLDVGCDRIVRQPGTTHFSGSALTPIEGVWKAAKMLDRPWQEAWARFSDVPSRVLHGSEPCGSLLDVGQPADFCLLKTEVGGALCWWTTYRGGLPEEGVSQECLRL